MNETLTIETVNVSEGSLRPLKAVLGIEDVVQVTDVANGQA